MSPSPAHDVASPHDARLAAFIAAAPHAVALVDREQRYTHVSAPLAELHGRSVASHLGRTVREVMGAWADLLEPLIEQVLRDGVTITDQTLSGPRIGRPHETGHWLVSCFPLSSGAAVVGAAITVADMSTQQEVQRALAAAEERYRLATEAMAGYVYDYEIGSGYVHRSAGYRDVMGFDPATISRDTSWWQNLVHPDDWAAMAPRLLELMADPTCMSHTMEYRIRHADGRWIWLSDRQRLVRDDEGRVRRVVGGAIDVTVRREAMSDRRFLSTLAERLQPLDEPEAVVRESVHLLGEYLQLDRCSLLTVDAAGDCFTIFPDYRRDNLPSMAGRYPVAALGEEILREHRAGRPIVIADATAGPRSGASYAALVGPTGARALVSVPLAPAGEWQAALVVAAREPREWTARDVVVVQGAAERIWPAYDSAVARAAERAARGRVERLQRLTEMLAAATTRAQVVDAAITESIAASGASAAVLLLRRDDELVAEHVLGLPEQLAVRWPRHPLQHTLPATVAARSGEAVWLESFADWWRDFPTVAASAEEAETPATAALPLMAKGEVLGVVVFDFDTPRHFGASDRAFLLAIARQLAQALERLALVDAARDALHRTSVLQEITAAFARTVLPSEVADVALTRVVPLVGSAAGALLLVRDAAIVMAGGVGYREDFLDSMRVLSPDVPLPIAEAIRSGRPMWIESNAEVLDRWPALSEFLSANFRACALLPLAAEGRVLGVLALDFPEVRRFEERERDFLTALAGQCAQALGRAQLVEAMQRARADAEGANRAKSDFLAVMSHELRTPLNAIAGHVQLMEMEIHGPVTAAQRDALERVNRSQKHLLRLINEVLNLTRIESGRVEYTMRVFPVADVVAEVAPMIEGQFAAKEIRYEVDVPRDCLVRADADKLRQILLNVLGNAAKFTPRGGRVGLACQPAWGLGRDAVFVSVRDTGRGIPREKLQSIFEPFVQVDTSATRTADGVGLGLAISRDLARGMGGDLRARSVEGEGATLTLTLVRGAT